MCPDHHAKRPRIFRNLRPLVLASQSPRRVELLTRLGLDFEVKPAGLEEPPPRGERPEEYALNLAELKAQKVFQEEKTKVILAADTIVVAGGKILGKPKDENEARQMLATLSNNWHEVITAYVILGSDLKRKRAVSTKVLFKRLDPGEIEAYLRTGEPRDKAGAYAIQGIASYMVKEIKGSVTNVVGLPLAEVVEDLLDLGLISFLEEKR